MKKCPFCAEGDLQDTAVKCKHCGSLLPGGSPVKLLREEVKRLLGEGRKTDAIEFLRERMSVDVEQATAYVSDIARATTRPAVTKTTASSGPKYLIAFLILCVFGAIWGVRWVNSPSSQPSSVVHPTATVAPSNLVSFKVVAHDSTAVILLVPTNTIEADLTKLVYALRSARAQGTLGQFIPPTTPGGSGGPFFAIVVFVMSDPEWATAQQLKSFVAEEPSEDEFGKRIVASYNFSGFVNQESGTIGYMDHGHQYTAEYKKLF